MILDTENELLEEKEIAPPIRFFTKRYLLVYSFLFVLFSSLYLILNPQKSAFCFIVLGIVSFLGFLDFLSQISIFSKKRIAIYKSGLVLILNNKSIKDISVFHDKNWICIKGSSSINLAFFMKKENPEICTWIFNDYGINHEKSDVSFFKTKLLTLDTFYVILLLIVTFILA